MKKLITFVLVVAMIASMGMITSFAAEDLEIDIMSLKTNVRDAIAEWPDAGWIDTPVVQLMNWGENVNLGPIDLTQYESVTIRYGRDTGHLTDENAGLVFANKPIQNADQTLAEDAAVYADFTSLMSNDTSTGSWADFEEEEGDLTVAIDSSNYVAGSDVILGAKVLLTPTGDGAYIGFGVTYIRFNAKTEGSGDDNNKPGDDNNKPGDDNNKPSDDNNPPADDNNKPGNTNTADGFSVAFMIAAAAVVVTVLMKKRAY